MERRALLERLTALRSPRATQPGAECFASPNLGSVFSQGNSTKYYYYLAATTIMTHKTKKPKQANYWNAEKRF